MMLAGSRQSSLHAVPPETFGALLRRQRLADDLTQGELGERFGVKQQTIGAWERNERPQAAHLPALAEYIDLADERQLLDLLERGSKASAPSAAGPQRQLATAPTDAELMKQLTQEYLVRLRDASLTTEDREIFRQLIGYYRERADRG